MKGILHGIFLFVFVSFAFEVRAQVPGCKDPAATNYNAAAKITDGSCTYTIAQYTPLVKVEALHESLRETSGLQWAAGNLWTFTDGGGAAAIYKIDTASHNIQQTVHLAGATNIDWEDIAFDGTYFYIGDVGNNSNGARTDLKIYKFPLAAIPDHNTQPTITIPATKIEVIHYSYADQPKPALPVEANRTSFDCEAMIVHAGAIHLFTKDWLNKITTHYTISSTLPGTYTAQPVETLPAGYLVTGADIADHKKAIVLVGYNNEGFGNHYMHVLTDFSSGLFFNGNKRKINLPDATKMGQAEGITFRNETYGYISNERFSRSVGPISITIDAKLRAFDLSAYIPTYILSKPSGAAKELSQVVLKNNGELRFLIDSNVPQSIEFKLTSPEGKRIQQVKRSVYATGRNVIYFNSRHSKGEIVYLTAYAASGKTTWPLLIQ